MGLLRDLRDSAPRRVLAVALLVVLAAAAQATGSALAGQVLLHRSGTAHATLTGALVLAVAGDLTVQLLAAGITADWAARLRLRLCRVALGQDLPTLESTPVGELLARIDSDVQQVPSELRGTGTRLAQQSATGVASLVAALVVWWPAGIAMLAMATLLALRLAGPAARIGPFRIAEEEARSDLAAVVEEAVHGQVGYVGQLPRVLSGTVRDNVGLAHDVDAAAAGTTAQLDHDLASTGSGLGLLIGHKGTRLSGGQLQRLALARALAPRTELLVADDVSSALDVTTELALWGALREHGVTVVGSTSKRAALERADRVLVLQAGEAVAQGSWDELSARWGHLAG